MIRAAFFDAAGTLFESREPIGRSYARLAREFGLDAPEDAVAASFRRAFGEAPGLAFGHGLRPDELRRLERHWWRDRVSETFAPLGKFPDFDAYFDALFSYFANPDHWLADLEAAPMLQRLKDDGLKLGVISNFDYRLYRILDGLDLTRFFDSITISSEAGFAKPRRELYDTALARAGVTVREAMHVGDSEHLDFAPAATLGLVAVLIDRENHAAAPSIAGRTARICSLASVPEVAQVFELA
ncbi:MAG: HAD-IA family hydrolase [Candidatus Binatus sp.]|uniref:HAD-IA family hydrolase n=1 Tax=Candidatus Binatus sp. TaxID=2811406 RepID=UPI003BB10900